MIEVLVLGANGMLGSMVARVLEQNPRMNVTRTTRRPSGNEVRFDATTDSVEDVVGGDRYAWVVNAIGQIKPRIDEGEPESVARAVDVNAAFPHRLAAALGPGQRVIQIATDCVFSGQTGRYDEASGHDPLDVYGKTKSLGEVPDPRFVHLRCSIVGPEERDPPASLLGWVLSQPRDAEISGFTNHNWNGVTTWHFAKLCEGTIGDGVDEPPSPLHVVPSDAVSKAKLLESILAAFGRADVTVIPRPAEVAVDRTLSTRRPERNLELWAAAGYDRPPTVRTMIDELARASLPAATG